MTLTELCNEVAGLTIRPDLVATTIKSQVKAATLRAHARVDYWRDLEQDQITFASSAYIQQLPVSGLPRFKKFSYVRIWDPSGLDPLTQAQTGAPGLFFDILNDPNQVLNDYKLEKPRVVYAAAGNLNFRSNTTFKYVLLGWFRGPIISPEVNYRSWIAEEFPYAIIFDAARAVMKTIGWDEQSRAYDGFITEQYSIIDAANVDIRG